MINEFKTGDIIAFSDNSFLGLLVKLFTLSLFVHVGIIYKGFLLEALRSGVTLTPISEVLKRKGNIYHCSLNEIDRRITEKNMIFLDEFVEDEHPKFYDMDGAVWLGLDNVFRVFGKAESPDKRFCSELVIEARKATGLIDQCIKSSCWSPSDVVKKIDYAKVEIIRR